MWQDVDLFFKAFIQGYRYAKFFNLPPDLHNRTNHGQPLAARGFFAREKQDSRAGVVRQTQRGTPAGLLAHGGTHIRRRAFMAGRDYTRPAAALIGVCDGSRLKCSRGRRFGGMSSTERNSAVFPRSLDNHTPPAHEKDWALGGGAPRTCGRLCSQLERHNRQAFHTNRLSEVRELRRQRRMPPEAGEAERERVIQPAWRPPARAAAAVSL